MPSELEEAVQAVVDAWTVPGISPEYHEKWQEKLSAPSEEGGWPVLARAIKHLVAVKQERDRGRKSH